MYFPPLTEEIITGLSIDWLKSLHMERVTFFKGLTVSEYDLKLINTVLSTKEVRTKQTKLKI